MSDAELSDDDRSRKRGQSDADDRNASSGVGPVGDSGIGPVDAQAVKAVKVRKTRPKLTPEILFNEQIGLHMLPFQMARKKSASDNVQFVLDRDAHSSQALFATQLLQAYEECAKSMFPSAKSFPEFLNRLDKFCTSHFKEEVFTRYQGEMARRAEERAFAQSAPSAASGFAVTGVVPKQPLVSKAPLIPLLFDPNDNDDPWGGPPEEGPPDG